VATLAKDVYVRCSVGAPGQILLDGDQ
jgi:hypothetical protein